MGLFCLNMSDNDSVKTVECVIGNCQIWLADAREAKLLGADGNIITIEEQRYRDLYLLETFALKYLEDAIRIIKRQTHRTEQGELDESR